MTCKNILTYVFMWFFQSPSEQMQVQYLKLGHNHSHTLFNMLFSIYSVLCSANLLVVSLNTMQINFLCQVFFVNCR